MKDVRKTVSATLVSLIAAGALSACSGLEGAGSAEGARADGPQHYLLEGVRYTPAEMEALAAQRPLFFAVTPELAAEGAVQVFRSREELEGFKRRYRPTLADFTPQLFRSNTTVYDGTSYKEDKLELTKGTVVNDLHALTQPDGESWGNQISSIKAADGVWTDLYDFKNLDPSAGQWSTFGDNYKTLPSYMDNDASSLEVGQ